jgi:hypothetical protein
MSKRALLFLSAYARDLVFLTGMLCLSGGLAMISLPAALIVPGALLVWLAIPRTK